MHIFPALLLVKDFPFDLPRVLEPVQFLLFVLSFSMRISPGFSLPHPLTSICRLPKSLFALPHPSISAAALRLRMSYCSNSHRSVLPTSGATSKLSVLQSSQAAISYQLYHKIHIPSSHSRPFVYSCYLFLQPFSSHSPP